MRNIISAYRSVVVDDGLPPGVGLYVLIIACGHNVRRTFLELFD